MARSTPTSGALRGVLSITGITRSYLPTWDAIDATVLVRSSPVAARREEAINRGLAKRIEQLKAEQERRARAAAAADSEFSEEFLNAARKCFRLIDRDGSGTLEKAEIVRAVRADKVTNAASYNRANFNLR